MVNDRVYMIHKINKYNSPIFYLKSLSAHLVKENSLSSWKIVEELALRMPFKKNEDFCKVSTKRFQNWLVGLVVLFEI